MRKSSTVGRPMSAPLYRAHHHLACSPPLSLRSMPHSPDLCYARQTRQYTTRFYEASTASSALDPLPACSNLSTHEGSVVHLSNAPRSPLDSRSPTSSSSDSADILTDLGRYPCISRLRRIVRVKRAIGVGEEAFSPPFATNRQEGWDRLRPLEGGKDARISFAHT